MKPDLSGRGGPCLLGTLIPPTRAVSGRSAAQLVYTAGDWSLLLRPCVGVIGSRAASAAGDRRAFDLAGELVRLGVVVVSGLAAGIDAAAHRGALAAGGATIGVIATGLDRTYPPEHSELQATLAREHLVVSPFPPGFGPHQGAFPQRNRLMAALTDATVVVEAGPSSGTRYQVAACLHPELGRPVLLHASLTSPTLPWVEPLLSDPRVQVFESVAEAVALLVPGGRG